MFTGYPPAVIVCAKCRRVKRFGQWVTIPYDLQYAINDCTVEAIKQTCDYCSSSNQPQGIICGAKK